ncbi:MAG: glucose-1-phosphate thymidylyltransferase RfbA [Bdellovibrionales bacterium]
MKGIILAGGSGTRLHPATSVTTKQLLPVFDKPMIYYPLSMLMLSDVREVMIITKPGDREIFSSLLGDGSRFGMEISYKIQESPTGIPDAYLLGEDFIGDDPCILFLGDNILHGNIQFLRESLSEFRDGKRGCTVFGYPVGDPERYGVVEFDESYKVLSLEEKPAQPKSKYAIPGIYISDSQAIEKAKELTASKRGETEIVDILKSYMSDGQLTARPISRGVAWLDTGTPLALLEASNYIHAVESRQGMKVACLEECAYQRKFINKTQLLHLADEIKNPDYANYLRELV